MFFYHQAGIKVAKGEGLGKDFDLNPLYPLLFLGPIYKLFGPKLWVVRIFQSSIGVLNVYLSFLIFNQFFSYPIAFLSSLVLLFYPPLIVYNNAILGETLQHLFLLSSLLLFLKNKYLFSFPLLALAVISRPTFFLFFPILLLRLKRKKEKIFAFALFLLPFIPFIVGNSLAQGTFTILRSKGGIVFLIGNNPYATGTSGMPSFYWKELSKRWEGLSPGEKDKLAYKIAFEFIRKNPGKFIKLLWRKTLFFWGREEIPNNINILYARQISYLKFVPLSFAGLFPLAFFGMCLYGREIQRYWIFYEGIFSIYFMTILFLVVGRYRLPIIFLIVPFFILGGKEIYSVFKEGTVRKTLIMGTVGILYLFYFWIPIKNQLLLYLHPKGFLVKKNEIWIIRDEDGKPPPKFLTHRYRGWLEKEGEAIIKVLYFPESPEKFSRIFLKMFVGMEGATAFYLNINGWSRLVEINKKKFPFYGWLKIPVPSKVVKEGKNHILVEYRKGVLQIFLDDKFDFNRSAFRSREGRLYFRYPDRKSHRKFIPCALGDGEYKIEWEIWK